MEAVRADNGIRGDSADNLGDQAIRDGTEGRGVVMMFGAAFGASGSE